MSLELQGLSVAVAGKSILLSVSAIFELGTTTCIVGKNGSGKSSLAHTLMGYPQYTVTNGQIMLGGVDITQYSITQRAHLGMFLALQNIPEIPGIRLGEYLRTIYNEHLKRKNPEVKSLTPFVFKRYITPMLTALGLSIEFLDRDLNVGFSGGEKRRIEMLQIELLEPRYIILDEIDSGLDIGALAVVTASLRRLATQERAVIIITHNFTLAQELQAHQVIVLEDGRITQVGDSRVIEQIAASGVFTQNND